MADTDCLAYSLSSLAGLDVLIVEDDPGDVLLVQDALGRVQGAASRCHVVTDGEAALRFARRSGEFAAAPRPGLILLDLNLPGTHGLEVLRTLKADEELRPIPVVVLSSSRHPADVQRSYALHANAYIVKPVDLDAFATVIATADAFFRHAEQPSAGDGALFADHPVLSHADQPEPRRG
jgi:CheY-like chemotaxis protein